MTQAHRDDGPRVLIVDDAPDIRRIVRHQLERDGDFLVAGEAGDGAEALELARRLDPEIVLLDLMMPVMSGREALPLLGKHLPRAMIVVLSALDEETERKPSEALGAFGYLEKTALGSGFTEELRLLYDQFRRALSGETIVAPSSAGTPRR